MNYTLAIQAADLLQGATKETMESVCRVKRDDLDEIANKMNSSMRK